MKVFSQINKYQQKKYSVLDAELSVTEKKYKRPDHTNFSGRFSLE